MRSSPAPSGPRLLEQCGGHSTAPGRRPHAGLGSVLVALGPEPRLVELRRCLEQQRADGAPFSQAWRRARAEALAGLSAFDRSSWAGVLLSTREAWRSAYYVSSSSQVAWVAELEAYATDGELDALRYEPAA